MPNVMAALPNISGALCSMFSMASSGEIIEQIRKDWEGALVVRATMLTFRHHAAIPSQRKDTQTVFNVVRTTRDSISWERHELVTMRDISFPRDRHTVSCTRDKKYGGLFAGSVRPTPPRVGRQFFWVCVFANRPIRHYFEV